jgi:hypothetical protein
VDRQWASSKDIVGTGGLSLAKNHFSPNNFRWWIIGIEMIENQIF